LSISVRELEEFIKTDEIPVRRVGKRVLITRDSLEQFAKRGARHGIRHLSASAWIFLSVRNPGQHIGRLNGAHDKLCAKAGKEGVNIGWVLYDLRQHADFLIMPTVAD
jgi:hypothetical protein